MIKIIPDMLTIFRMLLTLIFVPLLNMQYVHAVNRWFFLSLLIVFILICASDLLDGRIARALGSQSTFGSYLDVAADAIFIFSSLITLNLHGVIPVWFTIAVIIKFIEFLFTSHMWNKINTHNKISFMSDFTGRLAAGLFYITPGAACILIYTNGQSQHFIFIMFLCAAAVLALASTVIRCCSCFTELRKA